MLHIVTQTSKLYSSRAPILGVDVPAYHGYVFVENLVSVLDTKSGVYDQGVECVSRSSV